MNNEKCLAVDVRGKPSMSHKKSLAVHAGEEKGVACLARRV